MRFTGNVVGDPERFLMLAFIDKYDLFPYIHGRTIWELLVKHPGLRKRNFSPYTLKNHFERCMPKKIGRLQVPDEVRQKYFDSLVRRGPQDQNHLDGRHPARTHDFGVEDFGYPLDGNVVKDPVQTL